MAAAVVVLEQPTTFPEARNKVEEREREIDICVGTRRRVESNEKLCNESDNEFSRRPN